MIPRSIHCCWFGQKSIPQSVNDCINSWKRCCPNYTITLWNEENFDFSVHPYMIEAYEDKRWAFVSDLARLLIIYQHGGVYLDTDVELIKSLDSVLEKNSFYFAVEKDTNIRTKKEFIHISTGLGFGAEAGHDVVKSMIDEYEGAHFRLASGQYDLTPCTVRNTRALEKYGYRSTDELMQFHGGTIYPSEYFCPEEYSSNIKRYTDNTISVHHYDASWKTGREKMATSIMSNAKKVLALFGGGE